MKVLLVALCMLSATSASVHVAPDGDNTAAGTATNPLATVAQALERLGDGGEIVLHAGVYTENVTIPATDDAQRLTITGRNAVFDFGHGVDDAEPVPDSPGVYRVRIPGGFSNYASRRSMWEADTRTRYRQVADPQSVAAFPASYRFQTRSFADNEGWLYFHTSDGKPPVEHDIAFNIGGGDFSILRDNVTIRGLTFRNGGIGVVGANTVIEDCAAWNVERMAVYIGADCPSATVRRFTATDVGAGVYSEAGHTLIEDCQLFRANDTFESHAESQLDSAGIQIYHPGGSALIRGNLVVGFPLGIFCKGNQKGITIEQNTCANGNHSGISFAGAWKPGSVMRGNIVSGYHRAYWVEGFAARSGDGVFRDNLLWDVGLNDNVTNCFTIPQAKGSGQGVMMADPRFAAPRSGDFRLQSNSPMQYGALPRVPSDWQDTEPPTLSLTAAAPAIRLGRKVETFFTTDHWNPGGGQVEPHGTRFESEQGNQWIVPDATVTLRLAANDNVATPVLMKLRIGDAWSKPEPFAWEKKITLPAESIDTLIAVAVADAAGNWSQPALLHAFKATEAPRLTADPTVYASRYGFIVTFKTDVPCTATIAWGNGRIATRPPEVLQRWNANDGGEWTEKSTGPRRDHHLRVVTPDVQAEQTIRYRLTLDDGAGHVTRTDEMSVMLTGMPRTIMLDPSGNDVEGDGVQPWRTLQFAVDRALPGDRIVLRDGVYPDPVSLLHGGVAGAPIVIEAKHTRRAVLDVGKRHPRAVQMYNTPHVTLRGLEIRWFDGIGVQFTESANVTLENLTIWNNHLIKGRFIGSGFYARNSPAAVVRGCLFYFMNEAFTMIDSPGFVMDGNTAVRQFHRGCRIIHSTRGSTFINNSFTFTGNSHFELYETRDDWATFTSDFNNFAAIIRDATYARNPELKRPDDPLTRWPGGFWAMESKQVNTIFFAKPDGGWDKHSCYTLDEWQQVTGKDAHAILARPLFVDPVNADWRLRPDSPNIGVGKDGATLGAMGVATGE